MEKKRQRRVGVGMVVEKKLNDFIMRCLRLNSSIWRFWLYVQQCSSALLSPIWVFRSWHCILALLFSPLSNGTSLLPFHLCFRDFHFNYSWILVILLVSKLYSPVTNLTTWFSTFSNSSWRIIPLGSQTGLAYSWTGFSNPLFAINENVDKKTLRHIDSFYVETNLSYEVLKLFDICGVR